MPLIRLLVRNEYGRSDPDLYRAASKDEPKALLEGVAVSGLVGILRQLGDLAEFASEVFNDLHEQVKATAARGHKMMIRLQHIEAQLPPLEKAVMAQKSHTHFAYTQDLTPIFEIGGLHGSDWQANSQTQGNHVAHNDPPQFIMESYEECREPPRLFLLDKFDTAGAGACLKRYSDPSFFKTACTRSELMKPENVQREKNNHKNKRKERQQRSREVQHAVSLSQNYSRIQFASSDTDGKSSAEINYTSDTQSKSELAKQPTSFDSTPSLNCDECVLDVNSSIGPEEPVHNEFPTSKMEMQFNDMCVSVVLGKQHEERAENDSPHDSLQGQSVPGIPSVTWDEKTEILESTCQQRESIPEDWGQVIEPLPASFSSYKLEQKTASLSNVENITQEVFCKNQFDEIDSETDNYMDALTTMESEIETDSECQTKLEVELKSNLKDQGTASETKHRMTSQNSDSFQGSPISPYSTSNKDKSPKFSNSDPTKSPFHALPPHITAMTCSVDSGFPRSSDHHEMSSVIGVESANSTPSSGFTISNPQGDEVTVDFLIAEESPGNSKVPSIKSWINDRLLGVEPSKPPDFSVSNVVSHNSSSDTANNMDDGSVGKLGGQVQSIEPIKENLICVKERDGSPDVVGPANLHLFHPNRLVGGIENFVQPIHHTEDSMFMKQNSQKFVSVVSEPLTSKDSHPGRILSHTLVCGLAETRVATPGAGSPIMSNIEVSSSMSGINCSYSVNGFQSNESLVLDDAKKSSTTMNSDTMKLQERPHCLEQKKGESRIVSRISLAPTSKEQLELGSSEYQIPYKSAYAYHPSPPLEHMKISFHPINGLATSKMKTKFPDGHHYQETIQDGMFPAFLLHPDHAIPLQDVASESDDDTFCRSSSYPSEDLRSLRSESNSEQWESGELIGNKDCRIYNSLHRISSTTSISSSFEPEETHPKIHLSHEFGSLDAQDDIKSIDSDLAKDLQNSIAVHPSISQQEGKFDCGPSNFPGPALQYPNELPPSPPLPPLHWRITKPTFTLVEDKQLTIFRTGDQPNDLHAQASTTLLPPKPPAPKQPHIERACHDKSKKQQNGCKRLNQVSSGKVKDEREDFLHQIRNKSFNLRRTVTRRPSFMPAPATNINVVAILEKANAIRQAFASSDDDDDDENWSDD